MSPRTLLLRYMENAPLVAIIRGVTPEEAVDVAKAICDGGIAIVEVPLNSPDAFTSIEKIAHSLGDRALVGAGTVLSPDDVDRVRDAGGQLVVSPNVRRNVIARTVEKGMISMPGYFTPTEAFVAIDAGAHALKFFPAEAGSPAVLKAHRAVLPKELPLFAVGSVGPGALRRWLEAGAAGAGLGSGVYRPGQDADTIRRNARSYVEALRA